MIILSIDTLRYDHLSFTGYSRKTSPKIDDLAKESVSFSQAFAPRGQTWPTLTSLMTGLFPISHGVRHNGEMLHKEVPTLAQILKSEGYSTGAFLANYGRAPNRGFDKKSMPVDRTEPHHVSDRNLVDDALAWLESEQKTGDDPVLLWLHLVGPHADYEPPPPYDKLFDTGYTGSITGNRDRHMDDIVLGLRSIDRADLDHIISLYDGEIAFVDSLIGRVIDRLRRLNLLEKSVVVFFSDHGEELLAHKNYLYHGSSIYDPVLRVPLLIRFPDGRYAGSEHDGLVSLTDVLPTLLELTDAPSPAKVEGESLIDLLDGRRKAWESLVAEWARSSGDPTLGEDPGIVTRGKRPMRIYAIRTDQYKYVYNPGGFSPANHPFHKAPGTGLPYGREELYDLKNDPEELRDIAADRPQVAARLRKEIKKWLDPRVRTPARSDAPDEETREALKELGYIDVDDAPTDRPK